MTTEKERNVRAASERRHRAEGARERLEEQLRRHDVAIEAADATITGTVVIALTTHEAHRLVQVLADG